MDEATVIPLMKPRQALVMSKLSAELGRPSLACSPEARAGS